mmetsp:Transcript_19171/g.16463  ORF Transcript_19171/g.16463 Transcript_19171/m.16463 type:complete len:98 (-) Transcript_19171:75-368(-)
MPGLTHLRELELAVPKFIAMPGLYDFLLELIKGLGTCESFEKLTIDLGFNDYEGLEALLHCSLIKKLKQACLILKKEVFKAACTIDWFKIAKEMAEG